MKKGDELTLQFVVNSGVGYDWQIVPFDLETPKVDLLGTRTIYPNDDRAGESGKRRYRFRATTVGRQIGPLFKFYTTLDIPPMDSPEKDYPDFGPFRNAFGTSTGNPLYRDFLDFNNDGTINAADFGQFRSRFGASVP